MSDLKEADRCLVQGADVEQIASLSDSPNQATSGQQTASTDMQALILHLDRNTQAMLALVQSISQLIELGTSHVEEDEDELPVRGLDGAPIRRS